MLRLKDENLVNGFHFSMTFNNRGDHIHPCMRRVPTVHQSPCLVPTIIIHNLNVCT